MSASVLTVRLGVNGSIDGVRIDSRDKLNDTGVLMEPGERYLIGATGRWTDLTINTDAAGFTSDRAGVLTRFMRKHEPDRRMPGENWFCLIGCVGEAGAPFAIGAHHELPVPDGVSGRLLCFANDVPSAYWNNHGSLRLSVTRVR